MKARIIIPVWGKEYLKRMDAICLPALLAPGNLPHLAAHFECELVIVTETKLFDSVRSLPGIINAQKHASLRLVAVDDAMSHPAYYGLTITHALYRGFTDLGDAAKDIWCLFLNADFILADGSYQALVPKMLAGERLIFAPSYCTIEEEVWPELVGAVTAHGDLPMSKRTMAGLILDHAHFTIRAKIINCPMFQIDRVDQFYYRHDNDTLIGRQLPIAIVAFRPERVPMEPVTFWDYGVVSEVCPTANLCVLGDSDDFLMLELRGRNSMSEQLRLGAMNPSEIAADLSRWTTKDQRDCGEFDLLLHKNDIPSDINLGCLALENYYRDVFRRVAPEPRSHRDHYIWTGQVELHSEWLARRIDRTIDIAASERSNISMRSSATALALVFSIVIELFRIPFRRDLGTLARRLFDLFRHIYLQLFGRIPDIGPLHPSYSDVAPIKNRIQTWLAANPAARVLVVQGAAPAAITPLLASWAPGCASLTVDQFADGGSPCEVNTGGSFDFCLMECTRAEFVTFRRLYQTLRLIMRSGAQVLVLYRTRGIDWIFERDFDLIADGLPRSDIGHLEFRGSWPAKVAQRLWDASARVAARGKVKEMVMLPVLGAAVGTLSLLANWCRDRGQGYSFNPNTTSVLLTITVR